MKHAFIRSGAIMFVMNACILFAAIVLKFAPFAVENTAPLVLKEAARNAGKDEKHPLLFIRIT